MNKLLLAAVAAIGIAGAANAWTSTSPVAGYQVTASMTPAPRNARSLRVAVASAGGAPVAMTLHAWFVDADGSILGEAPLSQARASGVMLVASSEGVRVPVRAVAMVVVGQPAIGDGTRGIATQFRLPDGV